MSGGLQSGIALPSRDRESTSARARTRRSVLMGSERAKLEPVLLRSKLRVQALEARSRLGTQRKAQAGMERQTLPDNFERGTMTGQQHGGNWNGRQKRYQAIILGLGEAPRGGGGGSGCPEGY